MRLKIELDKTETEALMRMAERERRTLAKQAEYIVVNACLPGLGQTIFTGGTAGVSIGYFPARPPESATGNFPLDEGETRIWGED